MHKSIALQWTPVAPRGKERLHHGPLVVHDTNRCTSTITRRLCLKEELIISHNSVHMMLHSRVPVEKRCSVLLQTVEKIIASFAMCSRPISIILHLIL